MFTMLIFFRFILFIVIQAFYYPSHAGFPIGADDVAKNFLLEMHYDNLENVEGNSLRSKRFRGVEEQRKTKERDFARAKLGRE